MKRLADLLDLDGLRRCLLVEADDVDDASSPAGTPLGRVTSTTPRTLPSAYADALAHTSATASRFHSATPNVRRGASRIPNTPIPSVAAPQNRPCVTETVGPTTSQLVPSPCTISSLYVSTPSRKSRRRDADPGSWAQLDLVGVRDAFEHAAEIDGHEHSTSRVARDDVGLAAHARAFVDQPLHAERETESRTAQHRPDLATAAGTAHQRPTA